ncbi:MAG: MoxR family ATPase [Butyrivibrio sp.]|nr:MoxR family ATPase [Acetatifactor muris]MCM1558351.1 MoxR family ATPase [Butyrivibrio sp.]
MEGKGRGKILGEKVLGNIGKVIVGKEQTARLLLTALLADGHVLLEDVPGTGKTKLAKTLAKTVAGKFSRIQFTPDLLPSDITGLNIFDSKKNEFVLRKGPVFTNILLADEINRATPRTQAGLLECMEERQVTIDGETYLPGKPFFVIATQNPVETAGTFPLPEAQLDRFMMKLSMGLPGKEEELAILQRYMAEEPLDELESVLTLEELLQARQEAGQVFVHKCVLEYMVSIVDATRRDSRLVMGVSPRGNLALLRCARAYAYLAGRDYVTPDDVKALAVPVLAHRLVSGYGTGGSETVCGLIQRLLDTTPVPTEDFTA